MPITCQVLQKNTSSTVIKLPGAADEHYLAGSCAVNNCVQGELLSLYGNFLHQLFESQYPKAFQDQMNQLY